MNYDDSIVQIVGDRFGKGMGKVLGYTLVVVWKRILSLGVAE